MNGPAVEVSTYLKYLRKVETAQEQRFELPATSFMATP